MATLKTLLDEVLPEMGFPKQTAYVGASNPAIQQYVSVMNAASRDICNTDFLVQVPTTIIHGGGDTWFLAANEMKIVPDTLRIREGIYFSFPVPPAVWMQVSSGVGVGGYAIMIGDRQVQFSTAYDVGTILEYFATQFPITNGATPSDAFTLDASVWLADTRLIQNEFKWRYKREKGLPYEFDLQEAMAYRQKLKGRITNARTLSDQSTSNTLRVPIIRGIDDYY